MTKEDIQKELRYLEQVIKAHEYSLGNWVKLIRAERRDRNILKQHLEILTQKNLEGIPQ